MASRIDDLTDVDEQRARGPGSELERRLERLPREHPSSPRYGADAPGLTYRDQTAEFERLWIEHERRWPEPSHADRSRPEDPPGSWRGAGDRYLSPEQSAEADREIARMREPEESITATLRDLGGNLVGLEHRLKGEERLKEKIADNISDRWVDSVADAAVEIWDAVRYTFRLELDDYVSGYRDIAERLKSSGYRMVRSDNNWLDNPEYKGINTRWITPEGGRFELQFHTPESLDAKEAWTHRAYKRLRSPDTTRAEMRELKTYQRFVSAAVTVPRGVEAIGRT